MTSERRVDAYVAEVTARLRGSRRARRHVMDEIRDHLLEAVAHHEAERPPEPDPRADPIVGTFGAPESLAERLQPSVTRRHARITTVVLLLSVVAVGAVWLALFLTGPHSPWAEAREPVGIAWAEDAGFAGMKIAVLAGALSVVFAWLVPRLRPGPATDDGAGRVAAGLCLLGMGSLVTALSAIMAYVLLRGALAPRSIEWSDIAVGVAISMAAMAPLLFGLRSALVRVFAREV